MIRPVASVLVALAVYAASADAQHARLSVADIILTGGKIFTSDSTRRWAEAVAIRGERVMAVGTTVEVRRLAGRGTREIALGGRVVIPGINDAHDHVGDVPMPGEFRTGASPTPDPTLVQVLDSIRALGARTAVGTWITTPIGMAILNDTLSRRGALDRAASGHPVFLTAWWGHGQVLNTAALRAVGIADSASDPLGGWYERDATGRVTGRLDEYAGWGALRRIYSSQPERAILTGLRTFANVSLRMGVTSVQDMAGYFDPRLTQRVLRDAQLPIRVRVIRWSIPDAAGRNEREWDVVARKPAPRVSVSGRKWVLDATPIEQFALMRRPYPGRPGWYGRLDFPLDTVRAILRDALAPGAEQVHLHIVGDSTTELVLSAMESLAPDSVWRSRRVRFEHGNGVVGAQVERARRLGIVIAQPRVGAPMRSWMHAGIPLAYGSDNLRNPFYNIMGAVAGGAGDSTEAITREQAVEMYTHGAAYAEFMEHDKGTLMPGMLADMAVLSQDIFTIPARALPGTTSLLTMVGGRIVHDEFTRPTAAKRRGAQ